jgi:hypothetical protein
VADDPEPVAPEPFIEPVSAPEAGIAAIIEVPPLEGSTDPAGDGGGEFELLLQKIRDWLGSGELQAQWQRFRGPLKGLAILIGVVLLLFTIGLEFSLSSLRRIARIIAAMDVANATDVEVLPLKHAIASDLAPLVLRLIARELNRSKNRLVTHSAGTRTRLLESD